MFLLAIFKEGAGNDFLVLADKCHTYDKCCSLDIKVMQVIMMTLHSECSFSRLDSMEGLLLYTLSFNIPTIMT
jgi:hypothetical protein